MTVSQLIDWPNHLLEPVLITFNRSASLEKTLAAFFDAGLKSMKLHILDNASTDDTEQVVKTMQVKWPNLKYHKNQYNIGGNANILRSVEITHSVYHWVLGDDDLWLFELSNIHELIEVMTKQICDVIRLGWLLAPVTRKYLLSFNELVSKDPMVFASLSMISATIIKRSVIINHLPKAYQAIGDSYPQLVALMCQAEEGQLLIYSLSQDMMTHTPSTQPGYFCGDLEWCSSWFRMARFLKSPKLQQYFIQNIINYLMIKHKNKVGVFFLFLKIVLFFKSHGVNQRPFLFSMLSYGRSFKMPSLMLLFIDLLTPISFLACARKIYFKVLGLPHKMISVDRTRL